MFQAACIYTVVLNEVADVDVPGSSASGRSERRLMTLILLDWE
jgi:hypothetical protein